VHQKTAATLPAHDAHARRHDVCRGDAARPHLARPRLIDTHLVRAELLRLRGSHAALTAQRQRTTHASARELS
jgi:hypothetical protein